MGGHEGDGVRGMEAWLGGRTVVPRPWGGGGGVCVCVCMRVYVCVCVKWGRFCLSSSGLVERTLFSA